MQPSFNTFPFYASDLLKGYFWRNLFKVIWLFFPGTLFLVFAWFAFWKITQGKDLMIITLENRDVFAFFILALLFWSYVTWYTCRLAAKAKDLQIQSRLEKSLADFLDKNENNRQDPEVADISSIYYNYIEKNNNNRRIWEKLRIHGPRLLAFSCFTIIILAFVQLPVLKIIFPRWLCYVLLAASIVYYFLLYNAWSKLISKKKNAPFQAEQAWVKGIRAVTYAFLVSFTILVVIIKSVTMLLILLLFMQAGMVLLLLLRRRFLDINNRSFYQNIALQKELFQSPSAKVKLRGLVRDKEDKPYFITLNILSLFALIVYVSTIYSVWVSVQLGSFPFVILAFGVLLGLVNFVTVLSVLKRINFHFFIWIIAFILGSTYEPHRVKLVPKENTTAAFANRMNLKEYFRNWVMQRKDLLDSAAQPYPVYFVLANGGASRSGYWVASVLSRLEDESDGKFSEHLFCLSGASGGSVGNAAFFSLLRSKAELKKANPTDSAFLTEAKNYLKTDFLTYTLARMLGPDVFRHLLRIRKIDDRAIALSKALEKASGKNNFLYNRLAAGFSVFITQKQDTAYRLPILCINSTRMQDGLPGVISNIIIDEKTFNKRIDVLALVDDKKDLKLSSAVVLGASFPYVSPAGRIDHRYLNTDENESSYFVDGGYFDNSGAGVVNEMIIELNRLRAEEKDPAIKTMMSKLDFHVLHITNDPVGFRPDLQKVNPLINDLAAPVKTLIGAYSSQTSTNDQRLINYLETSFGNTKHYRTIPLYRYQDRSITYSMNWVISGRLLKAMDARLNEKEIKDKLKSIMSEIDDK
jgi:predicted acylesterase/phospholipase RssA